VYFLETENVGVGEKLAKNAKALPHSVSGRCGGHAEEGRRVPRCDAEA
jgi:hypothetical protein